MRVIGVSCCCGCVASRLRLARRRLSRLASRPARLAGFAIGVAVTAASRTAASAATHASVAHATIVAISVTRAAAIDRATGVGNVAANT